MLRLSTVSQDLQELFLIHIHHSRAVMLLKKSFKAQEIFTLKSIILVIKSPLTIKNLLIDSNLNRR
jgi:hypothetical protein